MTEQLTGYEASSVAEIEEILDAMPADADQVYLDTIGYSERAIAAVAAKRAGSGGGGSTPPLTIVYDVDVDQTVGPGFSFFGPTGSETQVALRDDNHAIQEDGSVLLPAGIFLCGGMLDTITDWSSATGFVSVGVNGGNLNLFTAVPNYGGTFPANAISAAIYAPPVLIAQSSPTACSLQAGNNSDTGAHLSGWGFWAMRIADYPT